VTTLEITGAVDSLDDLISEYGSNGEFWGEDEVAEAFRDMLPDLIIVLDYVKELL
jgi:hypothetical protein